MAAEVRKERSASKKANVDAMTKLRKQRAKRCGHQNLWLLHYIGLVVPSLGGCVLLSSAVSSVTQLRMESLCSQPD